VFRKVILTALVLVTSIITITVAEAKSESVAIIIGNRNYQDKDIPTVDFAHRDADAFLLFAKNVLNISDENIIFLKDATQARIEAAFGRQGNHRGKAFQYVRPGISNLYVFYSGHGMPGKTDGRQYILPVDAEIETADINGYPLDVLYENLTKIDARSVTVFLEACFTGNSHGGELIKDASGIQVRSESPVDEPELTVVTASSRDQLASWDRENGHGLFTEYLLRGLHGKADEPGFGDDNGEVTAGELRRYLNSEMRYRARRIFNREQVANLIGAEDKVLISATKDGFPERQVLASLVTTPAKIMNVVDLDQHMYAQKNTNVRTEPSTASEKIALLSMGVPVQVTGKVEDRNWYRVALDGDEMGYVFAPLLGDEKPEFVIAQSEQELKIVARTEPDVEPVSTKRKTATASLPVIIGRNNKVNKLLHDMGALLASQRYNREMPIPVKCGKRQKGRKCMAVASSHLSYEWVRIHADRCALSAALNFQHDTRISQNGKRKGIYVRKKQIEQSFYREIDTNTRALNMRKPGKTPRPKFKNGRPMPGPGETLIYSAGEVHFISRKDWVAFVEKADQLADLCYDS
jgi:SH3 domain-containing protein/caspase domain-containing protein